MTHYLCLRPESLTDFDDESLALDFSYTIVDEYAKILTADLSVISALPQLVDEYKITRIVLLLPSEQCLSLTLDVDDQQRKHLKQILPFAVEEQIIDPIEQMHLAHRILDDNRVEVVAISHAAIQNWLSRFAEYEIVLDFVFVDNHFIPAHSRALTLMEDSDVLQFRSEAEEYGQLSEEDLDVMLPLLLASQTDTNDSADEDILVGVSAPPAYVYYCGCDDSGDQTKTINADSVASLMDKASQLIRSENKETHEVRYKESSSEVLAIQMATSLASKTNLLQGAYKPLNANAKNIRIIKHASYAVSVCLGIFLAVTLLGGAYLNFQADKYFDQSVAVYKELFPKKRRIRNPVRQLKGQLSSSFVSGTTSEFLPLLDAASQALAAVGEDATEKPSIEQLRYDVQKGNVTVEIKVEKIDDLELYKNKLVENGYAVEIMSANRNDERVVGRVRLGNS